MLIESVICTATDGDDEDVDLNARGKLLTLLPAANDCDVIVLAAAAGDVSTMVEHLKAHPTEVLKELITILLVYL